MATTPAPLGGERLTPVAAPVETAPLAPAAPRPDSLPRHVAIIMDGNGRWAMTRGLPRIEGHRRGVASVRRAACIARLRAFFVSTTKFDLSSVQGAPSKHRTHLSA